MSFPAPLYPDDEISADTVTSDQIEVSLETLEGCPNPLIYAQASLSIGPGESDTIRIQLSKESHTTLKQAENSEEHLKTLGVDIFEYDSLVVEFETYPPEPCTFKCKKIKAENARTYVETQPFTIGG